MIGKNQIHCHESFGKNDCENKGKTYYPVLRAFAKTLKSKFVVGEGSLVQWLDSRDPISHLPNTIKALEYLLERAQSLQ